PFSSEQDWVPKDRPTATVNRPGYSYTFLVSSARNLQECSGLQKLPHPRPPSEDEELRMSGYKCKGQPFRFERAPGNYALEEQWGVRRVREALAGKCGWDFFSRHRVTSTVSKTEYVAGRHTK